MKHCLVRVFVVFLVLTSFITSSPVNAVSIVEKPNQSISSSYSLTPVQEVDEWEFISTMPEPLGYFGLTQISGYVFIFGGTNWDRWPLSTDVVLKFDPVSTTWQSVSPMPSPVQQEALAFGSNIYILGGDIVSGYGSHSAQDSTWVYDTISDQWSQKADMPAPRMSSGGAVLDGKLYVVGGETYEGGPYLDTVFVYDPSLNSWSEATSMPTARIHPGVVGSGGKLYVFGGPGLSVVEVYDPSSNTWSYETDMPTTRWFDQNDIVEKDGKIYLVGGCTGWGGCSMLSNVDVYDVETGTWGTLPEMPLARTGGGVAIIDGILYTFGGYDYYSYSSSVYALDLGTSENCVGPSGLNVCQLEPGDILLSRSEEYAAEFSIGGTYFTHAAMYIGEFPDENGDPAKVTPHIVEGAGYSPILADQVWETSLFTHRFWTGGEELLDWMVIRPAFPASVKDAAIEYIRDKARDESVSFSIYANKWSDDLFYCSKLVWRAYKDVPGGADLEVNVGLGSILLDYYVTPDDLYYSVGKGSIPTQSKLWMPLDMWKMMLWSPAHIMLVDPDGRRTGYDDVTGTVLNEIPLAVYTAPPEAQVETISAVGVDEEWSLIVTGYGTGSYTLEYSTLYPDAGEILESGFTQPGQVEEYAIQPLVFIQYLPILVK